jgi:glutaredoxin
MTVINKPLMCFLLCALLLLLLPMPTTAQINKWTDENGQTHFGDRSPELRAAEEVTAKMSSLTTVSYDNAGAVTIDGVVMYSTSWCGYCKKARRYFADNNIVYRDYDIENDRLDGRGVPVILVGDKRMNGFSVAGFEQLNAKK